MRDRTGEFGESGIEDFGERGVVMRGGRRSG